MTCLFFLLVSVHVPEGQKKAFYLDSLFGTWLPRVEFFNGNPTKFR